MSKLYEAYKVGAYLAYSKFAESADPAVEELTNALDSMLEGSKKSISTEVLESSERAGSATWGDKMELETPKNTGLNV